MFFDQWKTPLSILRDYPSDIYLYHTIVGGETDEHIVAKQNSELRSTIALHLKYIASPRPSLGKVGIG